VSSDALETLTTAHCRALLEAGLIGRVAFWADGPHILPVNYSIFGDDVVIRTAGDSLLAAQAPGTEVALEIDHIDYAEHRGWSVVATGACERIEDESEIRRITDGWDPRPWAEGERNRYLRLRWSTLTGRRIGRGWTYANEVPVRRRV